MKLADGGYTRTQTMPFTVPPSMPFTVLNDGMELLWTDGQVYHLVGEQYQTDDGCHAVVFEGGEYLAVHTDPVSYARGTFGIPGVE